MLLLVGQAYDGIDTHTVTTTLPSAVMHLACTRAMRLTVVPVTGACEDAVRFWRLCSGGHTASDSHHLRHARPPLPLRVRVLPSNALAQSEARLHRAASAICVVDVKCGSVRACSGDEATTGDLSWAKWSYWLLHSLLFLSVYTAILVLPHTRWRVRKVQCWPCHQLLHMHVEVPLQ